MLENILEQINKNLERIANAMEKETVKAETKRKTSKVKTEQNENENVEVKAEQTVVNVPVNAPVAVPQVSPVTVPQVNPVAVPPVVPVVPTNLAPENYTQEEIARAMSSAMDTGKQNVVFGILQAFNTNSLMGIDQSKYGDVARMLREAGIKI